MSADDPVDPIEPIEPVEPVGPVDPGSLVGAYVLGAVDEAEQAEIERFLAEHPIEQAEAKRLARTVDAFASSQAPRIAPPDDLWSRIEQQLGPAIPNDLAPQVGDDAVVDLREHRPFVVVAPPEPATEPVDGPARVRARRRWIGSTPVRATLAAAAVVLLVLGLALARHDGTSTVGPNQIRQQAEVAAGVPGARSGTVAGTGAATRDVQLDVVLGSDGHGFVVPAALPATDEAHTFQLWAVDGGTPVPLALVTSAPSSFEVHALGNGDRPRQLALTLEPAGGSPSPTTAPIAAGSLA